MKEDQEQKCHVCRFCKQSFSNGKKLGGHMRRHLALISAYRKKGTQENNQEVINGENGFDIFDEDDDRIIKKTDVVKQDSDANGRKQGIQENANGEKELDSDDGDDVLIKKSQRELDVDQDYCANVYVLRENPKRSWRVSNSSKDYGNFCKKCSKGFHSSKALTTHKRCHSRKGSIKNTVCEKCGKGFDSMKALYGHMRCHSIKRSRPFDESSLLSSSEEHDDDDGVVTPIRKKRSCARYKSPKPNHLCTGLSSCDDDEVEKGAICLMMLSRGVRNLDGVKLVVSNQAEFTFSDSGYSKTLQNNVEFEVSFDGSIECRKLKNKCKVGLEKDLIVESGSRQLNPGHARSTPVKFKSTKKPRSYDQVLGDRDATDSEVPLELKKISKDHNCPICFKELGSGQALGRHMGVHDKTEREVIKNNHTRDIQRLVNLNGDMRFKLTWVHSDMEWDPLAMVN